jgi:hypothetical protein
MSSKGVDLNGKGLPAPIFETLSDPDAADRVATGKKSQAGELTQATNQLLLQSTEDARYDPAPVERKIIEKYTDFYQPDDTLKYVTLILLLVGAFVVIKA